jgi:anti-sigma factor RsiW
MMNREFLEQLLMDQALKELPAETAALLAAYLAEHPELQSAAQTIRRTVEVGKMAVAVELPERLPALAIERTLAVSQPASRMPVGRWMSMAAVLMIGIGLGISAMVWRMEPSQKQSVQFAHAPMQPETGGLETAQAFWSSKTYRQRYEKSQKQHPGNKNTELQKQIEKLKMRGLL